MQNLKPLSDAQIALGRVKVALTSQAGREWALHQVGKYAEMEHEGSFYFMDGSAIIFNRENDTYVPTEKYAILESEMMRIKSHVAQRKALVDAANKPTVMQKIVSVMNYKIPVEPAVWANSVASILTTEIRLPLTKQKSEDETLPIWNNSGDEDNQQKARY